MCSYTNPSKTSDVWLAASFGADAGNGPSTSSVLCTVDDVAVCSWALNQSTGSAASSCGFFVAAGASVKCVAKGTLTKVTSYAQALSGHVLATPALSPAYTTTRVSQGVSGSTAAAVAMPAADFANTASTGVVGLPPAPPPPHGCPFVTGPSARTMCDCGMRTPIHLTRIQKSRGR